MAKTIKIIAVLGCIHLGEESHIPGGPAFDCEQKEARRLIDLGVAALPTKETASVPTTAQLAADEAARLAESAATAKAELLAAIAAAGTTEELLALMPEEEPEDDIAEAFALRHAELEQAE